MVKNKSKKKDYIDEHKEWQDHQFDPGHYTGGNIPIWMNKPGNRKKLGSILLIMGLFYGSWTIYSIIQSTKAVQEKEQTISAIFTGFAALIFVLAGIKLIKKIKK